MIEYFLVGLALLLGLVGGYLIAGSRRGRRRSERPDAVHQILLPFTGTEISRRAVDAALRLARAEGATLMPAYLATVPKQLPLDCAIPNEAAKAMPMLEAIEQRAGAQGWRLMLGSSAGAPTATPSLACSSARASIASWSRRAPPAARVSPAKTWSGCWRRRPRRCSSCVRVPRITASSPLLQTATLAPERSVLLGGPLQDPAQILPAQRRLMPGAEDSRLKCRQPSHRLLCLRVIPGPGGVGNARLVRG